jgi:hypothetical protein
VVSPSTRTWSGEPPASGTLHPHHELPADPPALLAGLAVRRHQRGDLAGGVARFELAGNVEELEVDAGHRGVRGGRQGYGRRQDGQQRGNHGSSTMPHSDHLLTHRRQNART